MAADRRLSLAALTAIGAIAALPAGAQAKADDEQRDRSRAETAAPGAHHGALRDVTDEQSRRQDSGDQEDSDDREDSNDHENPDHTTGNENPGDQQGHQDASEHDESGADDDGQGGTQPQPQPQTQPQTVAPTRAADGELRLEPTLVTPKAAVASQAAAKAARRGSRRNFRIRIRRGVKVQRAQVWVDGRQVKVTGGVRTTAPVDLRGMPDRTVTVKIRVRTTDGRILEGTRTYRTLVPTRLQGGKNTL